MFLSSIATHIAGFVLAFAQGPSTAPVVSVPAFPNVSCPIMGKPISQKLFVDTEHGRFWVCCKACYKDIEADVATAHSTAYPTVEKVQNTLCPVSGETIGKDAPRIVLQGFEFALARKELVAEARLNSQIVLARLKDPKLVDIANKTSPIDGAPIAPNSFAVIEGSIVRLSSDKQLDDVRKEPARMLAKAKELAAKQPKPAPSEPAVEDKAGKKS